MVLTTILKQRSFDGRGLILCLVLLALISTAEQVEARVMRIVPHIVDTLLLASAVALAVRIHQHPLVHGWLTAKVLALIAYIVVGAMGLHYGRTKRIRALAFGAALLIFAYIVGVALTRQPFLGWF